MLCNKCDGDFIARHTNLVCIARCLITRLWWFCSNLYLFFFSFFLLLFTYMSPLSTHFFYFIHLFFSIILPLIPYHKFINTYIVLVCYSQYTLNFDLSNYVLYATTLL